MKKIFTLLVSIALTILFSALIIAESGCRRPPTDDEISGWVTLIDRLAQVDHLPRLDVPSSFMASSFDPTGENGDYNQILRIEGDWAVLADIQGPGCITRFWMTGAGKKGAGRRVRFFFDNHRRPDLDLTLAELGGGKAPFLPPLAADEHGSWYSYVPLPFKQRCVVMVEASGIDKIKPDGWPRLFYQINYSQLPPETPVCSFTPIMPKRVSTALQRVAEVWNAVGSVLETNTENIRKVKIDSGAETAIDLSGPAVIRELSFEPVQDPHRSATERFNALRDLVLCIFWDDEEKPSVEVPFRDFFGDIHGGGAFQSLCSGRHRGAWWVRYPMPFRKAARLVLRNSDAEPLQVNVSIKTEAIENWEDSWGYFHAVWSRTKPSDVGFPHPVLHTRGRGKFVGCHIGLVSYDKSFWAVEADETIRIDGEAEPSWRGTGLEDYANLGWYGFNVLPRAIHGLSFLAPYRISEYRTHLNDPVLFESEFNMQVERGPRNASHAWMESIAYYYMASPQPAGSDIGTPESRVAPVDPFARQTLMTELWGFERLNDLTGAVEYIDRYLTLFPDSSFGEILRLRQAAYHDAMGDSEALKSRLEELKKQPEISQFVRSCVDTLDWFRQDPSHALLGAFCSIPTAFYLDGERIGVAGNPKQIMVWRKVLRPGRHVLAIEHNWTGYPNWVQGCLRTHHGDIITATDWKHAINPQGDWMNIDYDDSSWVPVGRTGTKGPPIEPYHIWVTPDPFINMQSKAVGLRSTIPCPEKRGRVVYRHVFDVQ